MNSQNQNSGKVISPAKKPMPANTAIQSQLVKIGEEIEALSDQLKNSGDDQKATQLRALGNQVEHFLEIGAKGGERGNERYSEKSSEKSSEKDADRMEKTDRSVN